MYLWIFVKIVDKTAQNTLYGSFKCNIVKLVLMQSWSFNMNKVQRITKKLTNMAGVNYINMKFHFHIQIICFADFTSFSYKCIYAYKLTFLGCVPL